MTDNYNDKTEKSFKKEDLSRLLPSKNCGMCGYARCDEFAGALLKKHTNLEKCRVIYYKIFEENLKELESILEEEEEEEKKRKLLLKKGKPWPSKNVKKIWNDEIIPNSYITSSHLENFKNELNKLNRID